MLLGQLEKANLSYCGALKKPVDKRSAETRLLFTIISSL
jgi:hypothetical protein